MELGVCKKGGRGEGGKVSKGDRGRRKRKRKRQG